MEYPLTTATHETLPNGLNLILDPDSTAPVVSAQIWVETGSIHEDRLLGAGLSHFLEHMVFKGTRDYDADTLATVVQAAGGHWNAYTTFERTVYYIDGPAKSLPEFLKCLTGLVYFPTLPETEFEKEKDVIRREIDMGLDDPDNIATRQLLATAFQTDPRRHPVIGHRHRFDAITYSDMIRYHRDRYTSDRSFIVISGDFNPVSARQIIASLTADCLPGCGREPLVAHDPPQIGPRFARSTFYIPVSRISMAWKCPALDHPDAPALDVLAAVLGRGRSSRLHRDLRDAQGLALEISAFSWTSSGREGIFGISADAELSQRDALISAIKEQISKIDTDLLAAEIEKAKRQIAASQFRSLTTASGRATDLASNWHEARDLNFTRRHVADIQRVTAADVCRAARWLTEDRLTVTLLDPLDSPAPQAATKALHGAEDTEVFQLPNGLEIALIPDRRVPLIHLQAAVRAGLRSETPETNGLNQLLAATLTQGTTKRSAQEIAVALESLGASISASSGNNALLIQAAGLAVDIEAIVEVFTEVILMPSFPDDAIAREKASQLAALEEALQDPLHLGFRSLRQSAYAGNGYGLDPLGTTETLAALDRSAITAHHARHFHASNIKLAIAGDFNPNHIKSLISAAMGPLTTGVAWSPPPAPLQTGQEVIQRLAKKQAVLAIGFPGASVTSEDRHALAFLQEYASDMAGPLFSRIREELGLAYQVGATQFLGYDSGLFSFYLATSPDQAALARDEILIEIKKIATSGIPADAFERVRSTVLSGLAIQHQSISNNARHAALNLLFGLPADENRRLVRTYEALTPEQVSTLAQRVFSAMPTIATVLPEITA